MKLVLLILAFICLAGCQVKESKSSGGLVADNTPVTNKFTLLTPTSKTYVTGEVINFELKFPFPVVVNTSGGTPSVSITVGSTTKSVPYTSGDGTTTLRFSYTVVVADQDSDGVKLNSLSLNGGTLTFDNSGVSTNCSTSLSAKVFTGVLIDNQAPTISAFTMTTIAGFYRVGGTISFKLSYSENVNVTGTPRIALGFTTNTGATAYATYFSGSGSKDLIFVYTITDVVADTNGFDSITSPLDLNSGTIKDLSGNDAALVISAYTAAIITASANVKFDGRVPYITSVTAPTNATYSPSQTMNFTINFNRAVTVTGTPNITLTFNSGTKLATYASGSGSTALIFTYTVVPGDNDPDGIAMATSITANGGTIAGTATPTTSFFSQALNNVMTIPLLSGVIIDAAQPQVTAVTRSADIAVNGSSSTDNIWIIGQTLQLSLTFNHAVTVNQVGGVPRVPLTIGSTTKYATYISGSGSSTLFFQYNVATGDLDSDASVALADLDLNGGTIMDSYGTNSILTLPITALTQTTIDGVRPVIASITAPSNGTYSTVAGNNHLNMNFTVNWSEAVNYSSTSAAATYLPLTIGATAVSALYASGNNSSAIVYHPSSLAGLNDSDGIAMSATTLPGTAVIKDIAGNTATVLTYTAPTLTSVLVDTVAPTITSVTAPSSRYYLLGDTIDYTVNFSETVYSSQSGGYPRISLVVGSTTRYLEPVSTTAATSKVYRYTVQATDLDTDGVVPAGSITISGAAYIRDIGLNNLTTTFTAPSSTGVLVDTVVPTISSVVNPVDGTYTGGDSLSFTVNFSEAVTVSGTPSINISAYTGTLNFDYVSGSGTSALLFTYTSSSADFDMDGLSSVSSITLNGGTITDLATNASGTSFTSQNLSAVFIVYPGTVLWTQSGFTNKVTSSGVTLSSSGAATYEACGVAATCRVFDGDDTLNISGGSITGNKYIYLGMRAAATAGIYDVISPDLSFSGIITSSDITTSSSATLNLNGTSYSSNTYFSTGFPTNTVLRLETVYSATQNYSTGALIPMSFRGRIGEVIMNNSTLSPTQRTNILNYLSTRF